MRLALVTGLIVAVCAASPASLGGNPFFAPKNRLVSRASLAGATPRSSLADLRRAWGGNPAAGGNTAVGWGRSSARWATSGFNVPTVATVHWEGPVGVAPIRFAVNLQFAQRLGISLRTKYGDRLGTRAAAFRRHWPGARRVASGADGAFYLVRSSYRDWELAFLFLGGRLREAQLVRSDFVRACYVRTCPRGFPS